MQSSPQNLLITGASSGVGFATALLLSENPENRVFALARSEQRLHDLHARSNGRISTLVFDLTKDKTARLVEWLNESGVKALHGLVHNAGFLVNRSFCDISEEELELSYRTNLMAPFRITQALLGQLRAANGAHVLHISSVGGVQGSVKFPGLSAYSSSKGALSVLTECLACELEPDNIRVNCLALGAVQTEMLSQAFPGYTAPMGPEEMAKCVAWMLCEGHRYFNGKILPASISTP